MTRKASSNQGGLEGVKNPSETWRRLGVNSSIARPLAGELYKANLSNNSLVQHSLELAFRLHEGDARTYERYNNHLARVTLMLLRVFDVRDPEVIAAGSLHDSVEDHARELAAMETKSVPSSERRQRVLAHEALSHYESPKVADLVLAVSNPIPKPSESQRVVGYRNHIHHLLTQAPPEAKIIKVSDFFDNAKAHRAENPNKRRRLDEKQVGVYELFDAAIASRDSLVPANKRDGLRRELAGLHRDAMARLALR